MFNIIGNSATDTWFKLIDALLLCSHGIVRPRNNDCFEFMGLQTVTPMCNPILCAKHRNIGYRFMFAEAWWILTGRDDVASIHPYSKNIAQFSDNFTTFFGAYGPKIVQQLPYVIAKLAIDNDTRQAVINIWRESPPQTKDVPCTLSVQFLIRGNRLYCIDTMRSSDAWLGWPYDTFNFSMLSSFIILKLREHYNINLELGNLIMNIGSSHLYITNHEQALWCLTHPEINYQYPELNPLVEWEHGFDLIHHLQCVAEQTPDNLKSEWCKDLATGIFNKK